MNYSAQDKENTLKEIVKFEILEKEHAAKDQHKQATYCGNQQVELFASLEVVCGGFDEAMKELNEFSEKNYASIEARVLCLGDC